MARNTHKSKAGKPTKAEIRRQLGLICASAVFERKDTPARFLRHLVTLHLTGRVADLKEDILAVQFIGLPENRDIRAEGISTVRRKAYLLRRYLNDYYLATSIDDANIRIDIPKGHFIPSYSYRRPLQEPSLEGFKDGQIPRHSLVQEIVRDISTQKQELGRQREIIESQARKVLEWAKLARDGMIRLIRDEVASYFNLTVTQLTSKENSEQLDHPRTVAICLMSELADASSVDIQRALGRAAFDVEAALRAEEASEIFGRGRRLVDGPDAEYVDDEDSLLRDIRVLKRRLMPEIAARQPKREQFTEPSWDPGAIPDGGA